MLCPYPDCDNMINPSWAGDQAESCVCEYRQPIVRCGECGMPNRAGATFCRKCRGNLETRGVMAGAMTAGSADFLLIRGSFRRPPLVAGGVLYALSTTGALHQLSPRKSAKSQELGSFGDRSAGVNQSALVNVSGNHGSVQRGWTFLAATRSGVLAMPLVTGKVTALYEPRVGEDISANPSEAESTGFRGLAANEDFCAFVVAGSDGDFLLTVKFFSKEKAISQPVAIQGSRVAGPALHNGTVMLCSDAEAAIYDVPSQRMAKIPLPREFKPLLRPSMPELSVSPGSIPIAGWRGRDDRLIGYVAGAQEGLPGLLQIDFSRNNTAFRGLPDGSSIYTNADGSLSVNRIEAVERVGANGETIRARRLQAGMPACFGDKFRCLFQEEAYRGRHRAAVSFDSREVELVFEDTRCNGNTCFGAYSIDSEMLVAYAVPAAQGEDAGMRFAHWSIL